MLYVMGDVHGNVNAWKNVLQQIQLKPDDELWLTGDVIDRNPGGISIIREIMETPNMHMLLGNHEDMMMKALHFDDPKIMRRDKMYFHFCPEAMALWFHNGGGVTYDEYESMTTEDKDKLIEFMRSLTPTKDITYNGMEIELCHAAPHETFDVRNGYTLTETEHCLWDRESFKDSEDLGKMVIFGHTPTIFIKDDMTCINMIHLQNNWHAIDCGAAYPIGRLACLRIDDMKEFYSNTKLI